MAFALSGREPSNQPTQGVALGWMLIGLSGRYFSKTLPDTNKNVYEPKEGSPKLGQVPQRSGRVSQSWDRLPNAQGGFPKVGTGSPMLRECFPELGQAPRPGGRVSQSWDRLRAPEGGFPRVGTGSLTLRECFPKLGQVPQCSGSVSLVLCKRKTDRYGVHIYRFSAYVSLWVLRI